MRNSVLPILSVLVIASLALWTIRPVADLGRNGPDIAQGLLRLPNKKRLLTTSLPMTAEWTVQGATIAAAHWRLAMIAAEDRQPPTLALMRGLGERLLDQQCVVQLDPLARPHDPVVAPVPIPGDALIRITTLGFSRPERITEVATMAWRVVVSSPQPPSDHPAAGLLPASRMRSETLELQLTVRNADASRGAWPEWWAAIGRGAGDRLLERSTIRDSASQSHRPLTRWNSVIPEPPANADIRWHMAFADELARGYIGTIASPTSFDARTYRDIASIDRLTKLVEKAITGRGLWTNSATTARASSFYRWDRSDTAMHTALTATQRSDGGWDLVFWQERPQPAQVFQDWLTAAHSGDATARAQLAAHLDCPRLPADLRARAQQALRP